MTLNNHLYNDHWSWCDNWGQIFTKENTEEILCEYMCEFFLEQLELLMTKLFVWKGDCSSVKTNVRIFGNE